ncbi:hypothetical protein OsJ_18887 [Oryza sativa Japonica Group]|uniref:ALOG domain-containing protein n=1 Tax=Oryza sativa subsp. japonica TaxID=39947 RepID=B9FKQ1_ORYSJ|nr:hypothetical protein OsJ_18887 [Oryza sativa Japonica Group]
MEGGGGGADGQAQPVAQAPPAMQPMQQLSRYESQKRRDWNTFLQYLKNHRPPLTLARCSGAHVIEFLKYLDQFGKTKAWGSLDALIGRLRAAYEESGHAPESNPFAARAVRIYLREVRDAQAKARGIPYEKKKRKRTQQQQPPPPPAAAAPAPARAPPPGRRRARRLLPPPPSQQKAVAAPPPPPPPLARQEEEEEEAPPPPPLLLLHRPPPPEYSRSITLLQTHPCLFASVCVSPLICKISATFFCHLVL